ncbi:MAG TPA: hypothetical protein VFR12_09035 [Pyrinomonadaceae bacterium]|nr:hypothetical protein [Pyrinomonadaceae bacterium]
MKVAIGTTFHPHLSPACLTQLPKLALDKVTAFPNLLAFSTEAEFQEDEIDSLNLRCLGPAIYGRMQAQWSAKHE